MKDEKHLDHKLNVVNFQNILEKKGASSITLNL